MHCLTSLKIWQSYDVIKAPSVQSPTVYLFGSAQPYSINVESDTLKLSIQPFCIGHPIQFNSDPTCPFSSQKPVAVLSSALLWQWAIGRFSPPRMCLFEPVNASVSTAQVNFISIWSELTLNNSSLAGPFFFALTFYQGKKSIQEKLGLKPDPLAPQATTPPISWILEMCT